MWTTSLYNIPYPRDQTANYYQSDNPKYQILLFRVCHSLAYYESCFSLFFLKIDLRKFVWSFQYWFMVQSPL